MLCEQGFGGGKWVTREKSIGSWSALCRPKKEGGMGFCDIRLFNLAMLAKQGWRLLQEKDSLLYGCFKAKYFPRCCFLEAKDVPNSSFVWKSLMVAQLILKKDCCWRVGDGSSIRALQDKWIPNYTMNRILHMPSKVDRELWVCDLTNWACHDWDRERIGSMFHREEAKAIYYIPLSKRHLSDSILWMPKN